MLLARSKMLASTYNRSPIFTSFSCNKQDISILPSARASMTTQHDFIVRCLIIYINSVISKAQHLSFAYLEARYAEDKPKRCTNE
jgi:hypothetical protein